MKLLIKLLACISFLIFSSFGYSQSSIWKSVDHPIQNKNTIANTLYFELNAELFSNNVSRAPDRFKYATSRSLIGLPNLNGDIDLFKVFEASNFSKELSDKYPTIKSYIAKAVNSNKIARISYEPLSGFNAYIYEAGKSTLIIKPFDVKRNLYRLYSRMDIQEEFDAFECATVQKSKAQFRNNSRLNKNATDGMLRQFRAAISTTGEYSQYFLDGTEVDDAERITKVLTAINTSLIRINGIFERDFAVTMQLIGNNDQVIFLDPTSDPYSGPSNGLLQNTLDNIIGDANYDVGHLFAYEGAIYGNAGCIACVCTTGSKGSGYTVHSAPESDHFNMIASHEFGHQFGGWHVQSSANCRSANGQNEVEPGSGSTIMGYAGICSPNVQDGPDDYFNYVNIRDITEWTINGSSCAQEISIPNGAPIANAGNDYIIPISTPFVLEGTASDPDGSDVLTFNWEQNNPENPGSVSTPSSTWINGPLFRSRLPLDVPNRYMPQISDIVNGNLTPTWEVLPSVSRNMNFVFTVRDNALGGGQTASDEMSIVVDDNFGPFTVTSQATAESWNVGETALITWDVANTTNAPISATNVDILLSVDGGYTYPYTMATTSNDGSESIIIPNVPTTTMARVMVKASNNIFFAINSTDINIQTSEFVMSFDEVNISVCEPDDAIYNFTYNTYLGFNETTTFSVENLPTGAIATFNPTSAIADGTNVELTISNTSSLALGHYDMQVKGVSNTVEKITSISLDVYDSNLSNPILVSPVDTATGVSIDNLFEWQDDINAVNFEIEIAADASFANIVDSATTQDSGYISPLLDYDTTYFWRVRSTNQCGTSAYSNINSFTTVCIEPSNLIIDSALVTSANVSWIENGSATSWEIEYGLTGFTQGQGTVIQTTNNPHTISGLSSLTDYDVYVRSNCSASNVSDWLGPVSFTTAADYCSGDNFYDSGGPGGNHSNGENEITTIYPTAGFNTVTAVFNSIQLESCCDFLRIYDGVDTSAPLLGTFTGTTNPGSFTSSNPQGALTFHFTSDGSVVGSGWDVSIICESISCPNPSNFNVSNVSLSSAELSWDAGSTETEWEIEYGLAGFIQGSGTLIQTSNNPYTITGLDLSTTYDVYLKAICGASPGDDDSAWIGPISFSTFGLNSPIDLVAEINQQNGEVILNWNEGSGGIVEDFDDGIANNWIPITGNWNVSNGTYQVSSNSEDISSSYYNQDFNAFEVETLIRKNTGIDDNIGLYFNGDASNIGSNGEWNNTYVFMISANGAWNLSKIINGNWTNINGGWNFSPDVNQGLGSWNTLKIIYADGYIEAYINNVLQGTYFDTTFESGKIGIKLYDSDLGTAELDYININNLGTTGYNFAAVNQPDYRNVYDSSECVNNNTCQNLDVIDTVQAHIPLEQNYVFAGFGQNQDFLNYNVYRDDVLLGTTTETTYMDVLSIYGTYDYHVTALYNQGESDPSNIATVIYEGVPDISVNPTALYETLPEGGTSTQILTISNTGDGTLDFDISSTVINGYGYGEPVFTTIADGTTYIMDNSLTNQTYSPGFSKRTCSYTNSSIQNVLVLEDDSFSNAYEQALINLSLPYTLVTDWNTFYNELIGGTIWDMVIVNSYGASGDTTTYTALDNYANNDGILLFAHWDLDGYISHPLLSTMGVSFVQNYNSPVNIYPVNSTNIIFNSPNTIPDLIPTDNQANIDGQIVNVLSNAEQVAYLDGNINSGAIVLNENENSIYNGFQSTNFRADNNSNGKEDIVELIENEISYLLGANWLSTNPTSGNVSSGSSVDIDVYFDATNLTAGTYNATIDITSNDPDEPLVVVPVELIVVPPSCPEPTNFTVANVTSDSVDLSWISGGTETQWEIEYGLAGFTQGTGTLIQTSNNPYILTGLNSSTTYAIYLRAICGANPGDDDSNWVGPISFETIEDYCSGDHFYDSGGPSGNYSNGEDEITTIYPTAGFNSVTAIFNSFQLESCCDFLRIYDGVDTNAPLLGSFNGTTNPGTFTSTNAQGALTFHFTSDGSVVGSGWDVSIICESISCPNPSNLGALSLSLDSAEIAWDAGGAEMQWELEYGLVGFTQGSGTLIQTSDNPYTINNLNSGSQYDVYVRAICGANPGDDDSAWVGPLLIETLTDYCSGDHFYDSGGPSGNYSNGEDEITTIYPTAGFNSVTAIFNSFQLESCCDFLRIYDGVDTNAPLLGSFNGTTNPGTFTATNAQGALTFHFTSDGSVVGSGWDVSIICESNTCPNPSNLSVSNLSDNSADINWEIVGTETQWEIEYGLTGFTQGTGTIVQVTTNPYNLSGLNASTEYDVYVRANCGANPGDDDSSWVGPVSFSTNCGAVMAPMSEHFEVLDILPNCWQQYGSEVWNFDTFADYTAGSAGDHTLSGNTYYAWIDGSTPNGAGQISNLRTMTIDVSQLIAPAVKFSVFSHNLDDNTYNTLNVIVHNGDNESETILSLQGSTGGWQTYVLPLDNITTNSDLIEIEFIIEENSPGLPYYNDILIDDIFVDSFEALSTNDFSIEGLVVYPNPIDDVLNINHSNVIDSLEVYSLLGQKIIEVKPNQNTFKLDLTYLQSGTYMLRVVSGEANKMIKIIKS